MNDANQRENAKTTPERAKPNSTYYLIHGKTLGKREAREDGKWQEYLFEDGRWVPDTKHAVNDRLIGYDPFEPPDSPYKIGSTSVMDEMEEINKD